MQPHTRPWQVWAPAHANEAPHPPQFRLSVRSSMHEPLQAVGVSGEQVDTQAKLPAVPVCWQYGVLPEQATEHAPQVELNPKYVLHPAPASAQSA
jgi:hypothetical protein